MPGISHEAPLELLRRNPQLATVLLRGLGVAVPAAATAQMAPSDLSATVQPSCAPTPWSCCPARTAPGWP